VNLIVVGKFSDRDPFIPIILSLIGKEAEELLDFLIDMLSLSIRLQVVIHGCGHFNTKDLTESMHEFGDKLSPSVANHFLGEAMKFPDVVTEELGDPH